MNENEEKEILKLVGEVPGYAVRKLVGSQCDKFPWKKEKNMIMNMLQIMLFFLLLLIMIYCVNISIF